MPFLVETLLSKVPGPAADELRANPELEAVLAKLVADGTAAHPDLPLAEAAGAWTDHLARHLAAGEIASQLTSIHAGDVHLVLACLAGSPLAQVRLYERLRRVSAQALVGVRLGALSVDELLQDVLAKLLVGTDGAGKLGLYSGRGALDAWLRVTLSRGALSAVRSRSPDAAHTDEPSLLAALVATEDPQLDAVRARCAPALESAIEAAVASLSAEDRTLLRLHFVDGLTIDDLAVIYRLHRSTLARRLAKARNTVFEDARARAMSALGLDEAEFQSLMGMVMSGLDLTLRRVLGGMGMAPEERAP